MNYIAWLISFFFGCSSTIFWTLLMSNILSRRSIMEIHILAFFSFISNYCRSAIPPTIQKLELFLFWLPDLLCNVRQDDLQNWKIRKLNKHFDRIDCKWSTMEKWLHSITSKQLQEKIKRKLEIFCQLIASRKSKLLVTLLASKLIIVASIYCWYLFMSVFSFTALGLSSCILDKQDYKCRWRI